MRRFYIDPEAIGHPVPRIKGPDVRHMRKVLRLTPGDLILLIDGAGYEYTARIAGYSGDEADMEILSRSYSAAESSLELTVAQGFLKEKKMDDLVRHLTELGISRWIPMISERVIARPDERRMGERIRRWEAIAIEALKQCGRAKVPEMSPMLTFREVIGSACNYDRKIIFWENETSPLAGTDTPVRSVLVVLGPEGGLTKEEIEDARCAGFASVSLGPRILRAETAALAACALVQYLCGDLKKSP